MYKVLLVDDEPGALKSLKYLLDWNKAGFEIAGEAGNGKQALEMLREGQYSLVITDIKMPVLDGIGLIEQLREFSDIPVIIMSGYEDFAYAKKALAFHVKDYLLKPAEEDDVFKLLRSIEEELEQSAHLQQKLKYGAQAMRDQLLYKWAKGILRGEALFDRLSMLDIRLNAACGICFALIQLDVEEWADSEQVDAELQANRFAVRNITEEVIGSEGYVYEDGENRFGVVFYAEGAPLNAGHIGSAISNVSDYIAKFTRTTVTIGIGSIVYQVADAPSSIARAESMLDQQLFFGKRDLLAAEMFIQRGQEGGDAQQWQELTVAIVRLVKEGHLADLEALLQRQWEAFAQTESSPARIKSFIVELFVELFRIAREAGCDYESVFDPRHQDYERIVRAKTLAGLLEITGEKCANVAQQLSRSAATHPAGVIEIVQAWVNERYGETISMKRLASQVYMNAAYLGQLFRQETGMSFNDYLLQVRMEKAKAMLESTDRKVYEIAAAVGYTDMDWFYKKFKRYTGLSPSEYRGKLEL